MDKCIERWPKIIPLLAITSLIFIFNFNALFCLDTLLVDDLEKYYQVVNHEYWWVPLIRRGLLLPLTQFPVNFITTFSPILARMIILFVWMVPTSIVFYFICKRLFNFTAISAITISVLPAILPQQILIPAFIDGSYTVTGLLFTFLFIYFSAKFLSSVYTENINLWSAIFTFCISICLTELVVFTLIPIYLLLLNLYSRTKKFNRLVIIITCIALVKILQVLFIHDDANNPNISNLNDAFQRVPIMLAYVFPFFETLKVLYIVWAAFLLYFIFILYFLPVAKRQILFNLSLNRLDIVAFTFSITWLIFTIFPFIFMSTWMGVRHFYYAGFGFSLIFILTVDLMIKSISSLNQRNSQILALIFFLIIIIATGTERIRNLDLSFGKMNRQHQIIKMQLIKKNLPTNSQIVIIGEDLIRTGGFWRRSSGYFQYTLRRTDVTGILPFEYNFYDPFDTINGRSYQMRMNGLMINKPLFLFRIGNDQKFRQLGYALQWKEESNSISEWILYKLALESGNSQIWIQGRGVLQYQSVLDSIRKLGISEKEILWGDFNGPKPGTWLHP